MSFINTTKTAMLMALLGAVLVGMGFMIGKGSLSVAFIFLILAVLMNVGMYFFSDKLVIMTTGAKKADPVVYVKLHAMVERLSKKAGIPKPEVYIVNRHDPNAFATGRDPGHAVVAVHTGLLEVLSDSEVEGVLAHEIAHVKNRDILISTIAAVFATMISYLAYMLVWADSDRRSWIGIAGSILVMILAPIAAMLIQMAISRTREYGADAGGAEYSNPLYLASALEKISGNYRAHPQEEGNKSMAHMYISNPFEAESIGNLFSTHPPMKERVKRLRNRQA